MEENIVTPESISIHHPGNELDVIKNIFFQADDSDINYLFEVPEHIEKSQSKAYLQLFKRTIIDPLDSEVNRLAAKKHRNQTQEQYLTQCQAFLQYIEKALRDVFLKHLTYTGAMQTCLFGDDALLKALHHAFSCIFHEYIHIEANRVIIRLIESLKAEHYKALSINFRDLMLDTLLAVKDRLERQHVYEHHNDNSRIARKILRVLIDSEKIQKKEGKKSTPDYSKLNEALEAIMTKLRMNDRFDAGQELRKYAAIADGHASWKWQWLGKTMIASGIILILGAVIGAFAKGLNVSEVIGMSAAAVVLVLSSIKVFRLGQQKGISYSTEALGKTMMSLYPKIQHQRNKENQCGQAIQAPSV